MWTWVQRLGARRTISQQWIWWPWRVTWVLAMVWRRWREGNYLPNSKSLVWWVQQFLLGLHPTFSRISLNNIWTFKTQRDSVHPWVMVAPRFFKKENCKNKLQTKWPEKRDQSAAQGGDRRRELDQHEDSAHSGHPISAKCKGPRGRSLFFPAGLLETQTGRLTSPCQVPPSLHSPALDGNTGFHWVHRH